MVGPSSSSGGGSSGGGGSGRAHFRSLTGCCICGTKSSSSRFTASQRYAEHFGACFSSAAANRSGDLCNACVLCVKRWLQRGKQPNLFIQVLDSKKGPGPKHMKEITKRARRREARQQQQQQQASVVTGSKSTSAAKSFSSHSSAHLTHEKGVIEFHSNHNTLLTRSTCGAVHCGGHPLYVTDTNGQNSRHSNQLSNVQCSHHRNNLHSVTQCNLSASTWSFQTGSNAGNLRRSGYNNNKTDNSMCLLCQSDKLIECNKKSMPNFTSTISSTSLCREHEQYFSTLSGPQGATRTRAAAARQLEAASALAAAAARLSGVLSCSTPTRFDLVTDDLLSPCNTTPTTSETSEYGSCNFPMLSSSCCSSSSISSSSRCPSAVDSASNLPACCCCSCCHCCYNSNSDNGNYNTCGCCGQSGSTHFDNMLINANFDNPDCKLCEKQMKFICTNCFMTNRVELKNPMISNHTDNSFHKKNSDNNNNMKNSDEESNGTKIGCLTRSQNQHCTFEFRHPRPPLTNCGSQQSCTNFLMGSGVPNTSNNEYNSKNKIENSSEDTNGKTRNKVGDQTSLMGCNTVTTRRYNRRVVLPPVRMTDNAEVNSLLREIMERNSQAINFDPREMHMAVQQKLRLRSRTIHAASASGSVSGHASSVSSADGSTDALLSGTSQPTPSNNDANSARSNSERETSKCSSSTSSCAHCLRHRAAHRHHPYCHHYFHHHHYHHQKDGQLTKSAATQQQQALQPHQSQNSLRNSAYSFQSYPQTSHHNSRHNRS